MFPWRKRCWWNVMRRPITERVVLDASAVLSYLQDEAGWEQVHEGLSAGCAVISTVNYAEIVGKLLDAGLDEDSIHTVMSNLDLTVEPFDENQAWKTGLFRVKTREFGLSLGDRACLSLASLLKSAVITADRQWDNLAIGLTIVQLR